MTKRAAIVGFTEWAPERQWSQPMFGLEACAKLAAEALADAGIEKGEVDGLVCGGLMDSPFFAPMALAEYLGVSSHFNETVDLGGATCAGMVWRAAAAIGLGVCETVLVLAPSTPGPPEEGGAPEKMQLPYYLGGDAWGSPQSQYDIPYGLVAATPSFAIAASRYMSQYDLAPEMLAKIVVHERYNAAKNPKAIFRDRPIDIDDVLASPVIADPLHLFEMVMPCFGGAAIVVTSAERAERTGRRPVVVTGFGEYCSHKTVSYMENLVQTPGKVAADRAFEMAGATRGDIDLASLYDCYSITVLLTLEDVGFCRKGEGGRFIEEHDFRHDGDFPLNTHGGQLGMGQGGAAGGMSHVVDALTQIQGRAGDRQIAGCDRAYVSGIGGLLAASVGLVLEGA